ncbi:hypothetical protein NHX12_000927, partial [Muraenolepis orangiensis]
ALSGVFSRERWEGGDRGAGGGGRCAPLPTRVCRPGGGGVISTSLSLTLPRRQARTPPLLVEPR